MEAAGVSRAGVRRMLARGKVGRHQKKLEVLFRNHANFYSMLQEALGTEDKETERKVNCVEATQRLCFLCEAKPNPPAAPCPAKLL